MLLLVAAWACGLAERKYGGTTQGRGGFVVENNGRATPPWVSDQVSRMNSGTSLDYRMYLYEAGEFELQMTLAPTFNVVPGRGLRFAVSVDDDPRSTVDALGNNTDKDLAGALSNGVRRAVLPLKIAAPGFHKLKVWAVDPAVVVERLVLSYGAGGSLRPSYPGPPESVHAGLAAGLR